MNAPEPKIIIKRKPDAHSARRAMPPRYGIGSRITIIALVLLTAATLLIAAQLPDDASKLIEQPVVARVCEHIDCSFLSAENTRTNPADLKIRDVLLYESERGNRFALQLSITNSGAHAQPLPALTVRLFDSAGNAIEERTINLAQHARLRQIAAAATQRFDLPLSGVAKTAAGYAVAIRYEN